MLLYKPLSFPTPLLRAVQCETLEEIGARPRFNDLIHFSPELYDQLNSYLGSLGFPLIRGVLGFKRTNIKPNPYLAHIDGDPIKTTTASLVIPVSGCVDTGMFWFDGNYKLVMSQHGPNSGYANAWHLDWTGSPRFLAAVSIVDTPMLCRVNIPHEAYSNGREPRVTVTLRFQGNPLFDDLVKLIAQ